MVSIKKVLLYSTVGLFFVFFVYILNFYVFMSEVTITIDGDHSPTDSKVSVDGEKLFPSGMDGKTYTAKVRPGDKTIEYSGPEIIKQTSTVTVGLSDSQDITFKVENIGADELSSSLLPENIVVRSIKFFGEEKSWLVIDTYNPEDVNNNEVYIFRFQNGAWEKIVSSRKISSNDEKIKVAPIDLKSYIEEVAGD